MKSWTTLLCVPLLYLSACFPSFEDRPWLLDESRILAIRGEPAEARPSTLVAFEALLTSPSGPLTVPVQWAFCVQPRTVDERTGVTASCAAGEDLQPVEQQAVIIADACSRFGPNTPPTQGDELPRRPADPDPSGGYFLPVRALANDPDTGDDLVAFGFQRIHCDLAGATRDIFDEYQDRYTMNINPELAAVRMVRDDGTEEEISTGGTVAPSASVTFRLLSTENSAEPFVVYSRENATLYDRIEALSVSWYVSGGELTVASQTLSGETLANGDAVFETQWQAPTTPDEVFVWAVLRDSRGGSTWSNFSLAIQ